MSGNLAAITSAPGLNALMTFLGAGAVGAYISSRTELSDTIGGAAIAFALVPPLCVVGISLQSGGWDALWIFPG